MKKSRDMWRNIAKFKLELFVINANGLKPLTFVSVFRTNSLILCLFSLSLVSHEKYMSQTIKNICFLFIISMSFCYFVFEVLIHQGIPNTLGK